MRFITAGESHGWGLSGILEGLPSGIPIDIEKINRDLSQRQIGYGRSSRMKLENDCVRITGGIVEGKTYGGPVCMVIQNRDDRHLAEDPGTAQKIPRPGHIDLAGSMKYGLKNLKIPAERASGRTTAILVAIGSFARSILQHFTVDILGFLSSLGDIDVPVPGEPVGTIRSTVEASGLRCPDGAAEKKMKALIDEYGQREDTIGGMVTVLAEGVPAGLGSFSQWDRRLDGKLAQALMSIPGIKGVEIGEGFACARLPGTLAHDGIYWEEAYRRKSNRAGGIEGGVSNGERIYIRAAMKPIPTVKKGLPSVDISTRMEVTADYVRSDVCAVPAASVVAESMTSLVILEQFLEKFQADTLAEVERNYAHYRDTLKSF